MPKRPPATVPFWASARGTPRTRQNFYAQPQSALIYAQWGLNEYDIPGVFERAPPDPDMADAALVANRAIPDPPEDESMDTSREDTEVVVYALDDASVNESPLQQVVAVYAGESTSGASRSDSRDVHITVGADTLLMRTKSYARGFHWVAANQSFYSVPRYKRAVSELGVGRLLDVRANPSLPSMRTPYVGGVPWTETEDTHTDDLRLTFVSTHAGAMKASAPIQFIAGDEENFVDSLSRLFWGLAQMHALGVIHCDLRAGNVLVNDEGVMTIIDYDRAKHMETPFLSAAYTHMIYPGSRRDAKTVEQLALPEYRYASDNLMDITSEPEFKREYITHGENLFAHYSGDVFRLCMNVLHMVWDNTAKEADGGITQHIRRINNVELATQRPLYPHKFFTLQKDAQIVKLSNTLVIVTNSKSRNTLDYLYMGLQPTPSARINAAQMAVVLSRVHHEERVRIPILTQAFQFLGAYYEVLLRSEEHERTTPVSRMLDLARAVCANNAQTERAAATIVRAGNALWVVCMRLDKLQILAQHNKQLVSDYITGALGFIGDAHHRHKKITSEPDSIPVTRTDVVDRHTHMMDNIRLTQGSTMEMGAGSLLVYAIVNNYIMGAHTGATRASFVEYVYTSNKACTIEQDAIDAIFKVERRALVEHAYDILFTKELAWKLVETARAHFTRVDARLADMDVTSDEYTEMALQRNAPPDDFHAHAALYDQVYTSFWGAVVCSTLDALSAGFIQFAHDAAQKLTGVEKTIVFVRKHDNNPEDVARCNDATIIATKNLIAKDVVSLSKLASIMTEELNVSSGVVDWERPDAVSFQQVLPAYSMLGEAYVNAALHNFEKLEKAIDVFNARMAQPATRNVRALIEAHNVEGRIAEYMKNYNPALNLNLLADIMKVWDVEPKRSRPDEGAEMEAPQAQRQAVQGETTQETMQTDDEGTRA